MVRALVARIEIRARLDAAMGFLVEIPLRTTNILPLVGGWS